MTTHDGATDSMTELTKPTRQEAYEAWRTSTPRLRSRSGPEFETWIGLCSAELNDLSCVRWQGCAISADYLTSHVYYWRSPEVDLVLYITDEDEWRTSVSYRPRKYLSGAIPLKYDWILYPKKVLSEKSSKRDRKQVKFFESNKGKKIRVGDRVKDLDGDKGVVVKINKPADDPMGTVYIWQEDAFGGGDRLTFGPENCKYVHYCEWRTHLKVIGDASKPKRNSEFAQERYDSWQNE